MTLPGCKRKIVFAFLNGILAGTNRFELKRKLLRSLGYEIGEGTKIVGPIYCSGKLSVGKNCWIGKNLFINGNGSVTIGDNCDISPEVIFQTGGHVIGSSERRAGKGIVYHTAIGNGCWIGARSTVLGGVKIGDGCIIAACACVCKDVEQDSMVGGVPARLIRRLDK